MVTLWPVEHASDVKRPGYLRVWLSLISVKKSQVSVNNEALFTVSAMNCVIVEFTR